MHVSSCGTVEPTLLLPYGLFICIELNKVQVLVTWDLPKKLNCLMGQNNLILYTKDNLKLFSYWRCVIGDFLTETVMISWGKKILWPVDHVFWLIFHPWGILVIGFEIIRIRITESRHFEVHFCTAISLMSDLPSSIYIKLGSSASRNS